MSRLLLSAAVFSIAAGSASAGGFAVREQSASLMGSAFAGAAASDVLSGMFWNPAVLGQFDGVQSNSSYSLIMPDTEITATGGLLAGLGSSRSSGDIGDNGVVPASNYSYQLNNQIVLGLGINAPFGLTTDGDFGWVGSPLARESKIVTYNFTPTVAYRLSPTVTIGAGLQIEYMDAQLRSAAPSVPPKPAGPTAAVKGDDVAFGFTAGILLTPASGTSLGLGFRSKLEHELEGTFHRQDMLAKNSITANVELPEILTLSLRQQLTPAWTLLGSVEWTNWSRVQQLKVVCAAGGPPGCAGAGSTLTNLPLGWEDGWFYSVGLEHEYNAQLTLRGGVAYEKSPIQTAAGRTIRVPDADRVWLSSGASYKYSEWTTIDLSYAHVFVEDATTIQGGGALVGTVDSSADIISVGMRSKLDWIFGGQ